MRQLILLLLAIGAGVGAGYGATRWLKPVSQVADVPRESGARSTGGLREREPMGSSLTRAEAAKPVPVNPVFVEGLRVRGYVMRGKRVNVVLSDGTVLTERDRELQSIERNGVTISGKRYAMLCPDRESASPIFGAGVAGVPRGNPENREGPGAPVSSPPDVVTPSPTLSFPVVDESSVKSLIRTSERVPVSTLKRPTGQPIHATHANVGASKTRY